VKIDDLQDEGVSHDPDIKKRVILHNGEIPHLTHLTRFVLSPGQETKRHTHSDMDEIFFVIKGVGKVLHNDKAVEFIEGSTFIVRTGEAHVLKNSGDQELILLGFGIEE